MAAYWQCPHCKAVFSKTDYWQTMPYSVLSGSIRCGNCDATWLIKDIQGGKFDVEETSSGPSDANPKSPIKERPRRGMGRTHWTLIICISAFSFGLALFGLFVCDSEACRWMWITAGFILFQIPANGIANNLLRSGEEPTKGVRRGRLALVGLLACVFIGVCIVVYSTSLSSSPAEPAANPPVAEKPQPEARNAHRPPAPPAGQTETPKTVTDNSNKPITENAENVAPQPVAPPEKPDSLKLIEAVKKGDYNAAADTLKSGTSPDSVNNKGTPAIILAAQKGNSRLVKLLIDSQADINARDSLNCTALMWASARGRLDTVKLLLKNGAKPELKNFAGESALTMTTDAAMQDVINQFMKTDQNNHDAAEKNTVP